MSKSDIKKAVCRAIKTMPKSDAIKRIRLFGSHLNGTPQNDSDVDLLIDLDESAIVGLFAFVSMQNALEEAIGKKVDLGTPNGLSKYIRTRVLAEAETMYEKMNY